MTDLDTESRTEPQDEHGVEFSVVIPTRDRPELFERALASVLAQEGSTFEVLVIDDGSVPPTAVPDDDRVVLFRNDQALGPAAARNVVLDSVRGDYIAFLDDDDQWLPGKLVASRAALEAHPDAGAIVHRVSFGSRSEAAGEPTLERKPSTRILSSSSPHLDGVVLRAEMMGDLRFDDELQAGEDIDFLVQASQRSPFVFSGEVYAVIGTNDAGSLIDLDARIAGRRAIRARYPALYEDPDVLAFHHVRMGHLERRAGRRGRSLRCFLTAATVRPLLGLAWRGMVLTLAPDWMARQWIARRG